MRIAVISDLHANLQAWRAVLRDLCGAGADSIVCLGDVVGYGPEPQAVLDGLREATDNIVMGNHEAVLAGRMDAAEFSDQARTLVEWTRSHLDGEALQFLGTFPPGIEGHGALFVHAEAADPMRFQYIEDTATARANLECRAERIVFVGHTHLPGVFVLDPEGGAIVHGMPPVVHLRPPMRYLVNAGSVGEPRDLDPRGAYALFDDERGTIEFRRFEFDIAAYRSALERSGLAYEPYFLSSHRRRAFLAGAGAAETGAGVPGTDLPAAPRALADSRILRPIAGVSQAPAPLQTGTKVISMLPEMAAASREVIRRTRRARSRRVLARVAVALLFLGLAGAAVWEFNKSRPAGEGDSGAAPDLQPLVPPAPDPPMLPPATPAGTDPTRSSPASPPLPLPPIASLSPSAGAGRPSFEPPRLRLAMGPAPEGAPAPEGDRDVLVRGQDGDREHPGVEGPAPEGQSTMPAGSVPAGGDTGAMSLSPSSPSLSPRGQNGFEETAGEHDVSEPESKRVSDFLTSPGASPQGPVMPTLSRPPSYKLARSAAARVPSQSAAAATRPPGSLQSMGGDRSQASISLLPGPASASGPGTEGAVWLVCFGRGDPFLAPGGDEWNDMADSYVPPAPARRTWRDVTGKRQIEAVVTAVEGPLVATRGGVPGLRLSMFGHIVPDGATDGSWAADGRPASLTIQLSGLRPQARYALHILASGNTTKGGRVEEWFAEGAPGPGGRHWSGGTDGAERTAPLVPTAEGTLTLTFRFGAGYGTSGLNTLGIRETAAGPGAP